MFDEEWFLYMHDSMVDDDFHNRVIDFDLFCDYIRRIYVQDQLIYTVEMKVKFKRLEKLLFCRELESIDDLNPDNERYLSEMIKDLIREIEFEAFRKRQKLLYDLRLLFNNNNFEPYNHMGSFKYRNNGFCRLSRAVVGKITVPSRLSTARESKIGEYYAGVDEKYVARAKLFYQTYSLQDRSGFFIWPESLRIIDSSFQTTFQ